MSEVVDARFAEEEREALLAEVRSYLPAFLGSATVERVDPVGDVRELLNLRTADLRVVTAVHFALSSPITAFVGALRAGLRRPITSSVRAPVVTQAVRGPIDWGATMRHRATGQASAGVYVVRPARRIFDTPENRALVWLLARLESELRLGLSRVPSESETAADWRSRISLAAQAASQARRHPWLREIPGERPGSVTLRRLGAARTSFYKLRIPAVLDALRRYVDDPGPEETTELICARYFEPRLTWQLFELVIALRLARAFADVAVGKRRARLLVGTGRAPFAAYRLADGDEIRLWYQAWPTNAGPSLHASARNRHRIDAGGTRPDLVLERVGARPRVILLELKATRNPSYLAQGLSQLLSYVNERTAVLNEPACAWLVAPASNAFTEAPAPDDEPLWVVDADSVANVAVERLVA